MSIYRYWDDDSDDPFGLDDEPQEGQKFATQGGGIAVFQDDQYVWEEVPEWMTEARKGDVIPEEWDLIPINR